MKAGNIAQAATLPQQFDINHLFGNLYELTHTDNAKKISVTDRETEQKRTEGVRVDRTSYVIKDDSEVFTFVGAECSWNIFPNCVFWIFSICLFTHLL